jgi:hypothetical protein
MVNMLFSCCSYFIIVEVFISGNYASLCLTVLAVPADHGQVFVILPPLTAIAALVKVATVIFAFIICLLVR